MQTASCSSCSRRLGAGLTRSAVPVQITPQPRRRHLQPVCKAGKEETIVSRSSESSEKQHIASSASTAVSAAAGLLGPLLLDVQSASAHDPLLQGKIVSLVHPTLMFFLFGATAWTGWLGLQWR